MNESTLEELSSSGALDIAVEREENQIILTIPKELISSWSEGSPEITSGGVPIEVTVIDDDPKISFSLSSIKDNETINNCFIPQNHPDSRVCSNPNISIIEVPRDQIQANITDIWSEASAILAIGSAFSDIATMATIAASGTTLTVPAAGVILVKTVFLDILAPKGIDYVASGNSILLVNGSDDFPNPPAQSLPTGLYSKTPEYLIGLTYTRRIWLPNQYDVSPSISFLSTSNFYADDFQIYDVTPDSFPYETISFKPKKGMGYILRWNTPIYVTETLPEGAKVMITLNGAPGIDSQEIVDYHNQTIEETNSDLLVPPNPDYDSKGLLGYYPLNNNALDTSGNDNSPISNTESLTFSEQTLRVQRTSVELPELSVDAFSVSLFGRFESIAGGTGGGVFYSFGTNHHESESAFRMVLSSTGVVFPIIEGPNPGNLTIFSSSEGVNISDESWYHLTATYDGTKLSFYVNGQLQSEVSSTVNYTFNNVRQAIGKHWWNNYTSSAEILTGNIDELVVYDKALTSSEVTSLYETAVSNTQQ